MIIDVNPEFGYELVCSMPYAYWLHQRGELDGVITCKNMKPFYYFCDNVVEKYNHRSIDNNTNGVQNLPNTWIHHNAMAVFGKGYGDLTEDEQHQVNGVLDYTKWTPPPLLDYYFDSSIDLPNKFVVVCNRYNLEHGEQPVGFFNIQCLYEIFTYLTETGYNVIYKRPRNTEFTTDPNELQNLDIKANVEGVGVITDYQLVEMLDGVFLIDDYIDKISNNYNESQLKIFSRASGFVSMGGGNSILCSYFKKPLIIYVNTSKDIRPGYFEGDSYFKKLSQSIYPIIDKKDDIIKRGYKDYSELYNTVKKVFKHYEN
jgi:hypothetical protein